MSRLQSVYYITRASELKLFLCLYVQNHYTLSTPELYGSQTVKTSLTGQDYKAHNQPKRRLSLMNAVDGGKPLCCHMLQYQNKSIPPPKSELCFGSHPPQY
eukprot:scaffold188266_cov44-Prasinocladus_malaysianus.AAC.1